MMKKQGNTYCFDDPPRVLSYASVVGKKEGEGPLSRDFDYISNDNTFGEQTWEKAESRMMSMAFERVLNKGQLPPEQLGCVLGGDLLNQCISTTFALRPTNVPFFGLYGACSTMAEGLVLASCLVDGGFERTVCAITSSHFCAAERQYRYPLEYGGQRPQTAQWTATASGAVVLHKGGKGVKITKATPGRIADPGVTAQTNMGAAMALSAYETLQTYFQDTKTGPTDYDLIVTGDLGKVGHQIVLDLFQRDGVDMRPTYDDCGLLLYDGTQDVHSGGSGCGCSAAVLCSYLLKALEQKIFRKVLFCGTGALLSPTSSNQGQSIPGICHLVCLEADV
ncbi:MAG TPA: stage V sporulation protein AD [Firmicutes bacterium]|nr:stage V sporulation protein AD [Bacillota bacterium]